MSEKRNTCKMCGGERDPRLGNRMCRPCYNAYVAALRADPIEGVMAVPTEEQGDWEGRLRVFETVFEKHGLVAGEVWDQVKGARREVSA